MIKTTAPDSKPPAAHDRVGEPRSASPGGDSFRTALHPVVEKYHGPQAPAGIRCANAITGFMGSWKFLWTQTVLVVLWIVANVVAWRHHFDPYPFILLNLAFSTQAAYAAPLIFMAGNVAAQRDRELWENDYATNQRAYEKIESLEDQVRALVIQNNIMLRQSQELLALLVSRNGSETPANLSTVETDRTLR